MSRHRRAEAREVPEAFAASDTVRRVRWGENASMIASPLARPPMPSGRRPEPAFLPVSTVVLTAGMPVNDSG